MTSREKLRYIRPLNDFQRNYRRELKLAEYERLEKKFALHLLADRIDGAERNFSGWDPESRMELDFAWPGKKVAVEVQGGIQGQPVYCNHCYRRVTRIVKGRETWVNEATGHGTRNGLTRDYKKMNRAQLLGWIVLEISESMIDDGTAVGFLKHALQIHSLP